MTPTTHGEEVLMTLKAHEISCAQVRHKKAGKGTIEYSAVKKIGT
jgi:hypothetical protein